MIYTPKWQIRNQLACSSEGTPVPRATKEDPTSCIRVKQCLLKTLNEDQPVTPHMSSKDIVLKKAYEEATLRRSCTLGKDPGSAERINPAIKNRSLNKDRSLRPTGSTKSFIDDEAAVADKYKRSFSTGQSGCGAPSGPRSLEIKIGPRL